MKLKLRKLGYVFLIPLISIALIMFPAFNSQAATLTSAYIMLTRMKASLTSTANLEIYIALETTGAVGTGGTLTLEFPDAGDTDWCDTAGSDLTVAGVASTPADSTGAYDVDAALPGTLSAACAQGTGASSADTITITGLTGLTAATTYGVKVSNGTTAKLGTSTAGTHIVVLTVTQGATIETKSFGINIVADDEVDISATVVDVQTVTCSLGSNAVGLGNLYKGGSYITGNHTITISTSSSAAGYFWAAYGTGDGSTDAGLYKSSATTYLIASSNAGTTVDISAVGSEGFGMNVSEPSGSTAGTGYSSSGNGAGVFGSIGLAAAEAELILYQMAPQPTSEDSTVTYGARAGSSAEAGAYAETVTFVCGGYY